MRTKRVATIRNLSTAIKGFFLTHNTEAPSNIRAGIYDAEVIGVHPTIFPQEDGDTLSGVDFVFALFPRLGSGPSGPRRPLLEIGHRGYSFNWGARSRLRRVVESILGRTLDDYEALGGVYSKNLLFKPCMVQVARTAEAIRYNTGDLRVVNVLPVDAIHREAITQRAAG